MSKEPFNNPDYKPDENTKQNTKEMPRLISTLSTQNSKAPTLTLIAEY